MLIAPAEIYVGDTPTVYLQTSRYDTGAAADATGTPAYEVYEEETGTAILSGSFALLNDSGTVGLYSEQITASAANGFEADKTYLFRATATVNAVAHAWIAPMMCRPPLNRVARYFNNKVQRNLNTGTVTIRNDGDTADLFTMTDTVSGSTQTKGSMT